jgi:hypothetical protein
VQENPLEPPLHPATLASGLQLPDVPIGWQQ